MEIPQVWSQNLAGSWRLSILSLLLVIGCSSEPSVDLQRKPKPTPTPTPTLPPPAKQDNIWGAVVDPAVLGNCTAQVHDKYLLGGGDGFAYRTWHPLQDPSGCTFAHEHGANPTTQTNQTIKAKPVLFGYAARRMTSAEEPNGHAEAHEGYKVFVVNKGEVNDEGRTSLIDSRIVAHMGTSAPRRFVLRHHSVDVDVIDSVGKSVSVRVMGDTGPSVTAPSEDAGCTQRPEGGSKAVMTLQANCKQAPYEIWAFRVELGVAQVNVATSAFDPITARDSANPTRLLYIWDAAVDAIVPFPANPRNQFRGCDRESYAGPLYWYNPKGPTTFTTDAMGQMVAASDPKAIHQYVSQHDTIEFKATADGLSQFKQRRQTCGPSLGLKN